MTSVAHPFGTVAHLRASSAVNFASGWPDRHESDMTGHLHRFVNCGVGRHRRILRRSAGKHVLPLRRPRRRTRRGTRRERANANHNSLAALEPCCSFSALERVRFLEKTERLSAGKHFGSTPDNRNHPLVCRFARRKAKRASLALAETTARSRAYNSASLLAILAEKRMSLQTDALRAGISSHAPDTTVPEPRRNGSSTRNPFGLCVRPNATAAPIPPRNLRRITKPAMNWQAQVVEKVGGMTDDLCLGTNFFRLIVGPKPIKHRLFIFLTKTEQDVLTVFS